MKTYVLQDFDSRECDVVAVVRTDCDVETFDELCRWSHHLGGEEANEVLGLDASHCVWDFDYLLLLLEAYGKKYEVLEVDVIDW